MVTIIMVLRTSGSLSSISKYCKNDLTDRKLMSTANPATLKSRALIYPLSRCLRNLMNSKINASGIKKNPEIIINAP
ncbi:hypothetical protein GCM10010911_55970 [Paenibacillus nasutitermitis]|uniref:Uncharacterized protein n=1 Tax=Paenibacillus nasutitermitis TaxID=1652958 RepID=A0A916ZEA1_9BACL|nr:hypothetical protein GCM10010911_55970 [Paenibacillus nasutitermitis]